MVGLLRKALPFLMVAVIAGVLYDGWFFYSRWRDAREMERSRQATETAEARRTIEMMGGGELKILDFYASPAAIHRGQHTTICYGVFGAKSVRIEPPVQELHPAVSYCLQVEPTRSTEYKLVAEDGSGRTTSQSLLLRVGP